MLATIKLSPCVQKCQVIKMATSARQLVSETQLWDRAMARKRSDRKGKCRRRRSSSGNGLTRGSISLWCGYVLIWTTKTGPLCRRFGVLFVESTKLRCVGSKTPPGHGSMVLATIRQAISPITPIYAINATCITCIFCNICTVAMKHNWGEPERAPH